MTKFILSGLLALAAATSATAAGCPFSPHAMKMHQHGPLYNYGPYYGYAPFAPYGPWNSDLTLNTNCGGGNCGRAGINWPHLNLGHKNSCNTCGKSGCSGWGHYASHTLKNVFHRTHPCHSKAGCDSCSSAAGLAFSPIQTVSATVPAK
jgi:hypothetical protein